MKKWIFTFFIVSIIAIVLITQRYRIFYTYSKGTLDSLDVMLRTNVITGNTEMLNPLTLEWLNSDDLSELKDQANKEDTEKRITALNNEIKILKDIVDGKEKFDTKSWEYIKFQRSGKEMIEFLNDEIDSLEKELEEIQRDGK